MYQSLGSPTSSSPLLHSPKSQSKTCSQDIPTTPKSLEVRAIAVPCTPGYDELVQLYGAGPEIGSPMSPTLNVKRAKVEGGRAVRVSIVNEENHEVSHEKRYHREIYPQASQPGQIIDQLVKDNAEMKKRIEGLCKDNTEMKARIQYLEQLVQQLLENHHS